MKKVGYLLPHQLEQLLEQEVIAVNLSIIANKKQYAKVYYHILKGIASNIHAVFANHHIMH